MKKGQIGYCVDPTQCTPLNYLQWVQISQVQPGGLLELEGKDGVFESKYFLFPSNEMYKPGDKLRMMLYAKGHDTNILYTYKAVKDERRCLLRESTTDGLYVWRFVPAELFDNPFVCPDCKGSGRYVGFTTVTICDRCQSKQFPTSGPEFRDS